MRRILVIHNPVAGRRRRALVTQVIHELASIGFEVTVRHTARPSHAEAIARSEASAFDLIIAAGGDGTVNEVLNGLGDASLPLAILPIGTANVLAAEAGLPVQPGTFAAFLAAMPPRPVWLAEIEGRRFALMATVGFDAAVVGSVSERLKYAMGKGAYLVAACRCWTANRPRRYRLVVDGQEFEAGAAVIAKSRYYGGRFSVAPEARVSCPLLHVALLSGTRRRDILRHVAALARGTLHQQRDVRIIAGHQVTITGEDGAPVQVDGDIRATVPATIRALRHPVMLFRVAAPGDEVAAITGAVTTAPAISPVPA